MRSGAALGTQRHRRTCTAQAAQPTHSRCAYTLTLISVKFTILLCHVMSKILRNRQNSQSGFWKCEGLVKSSNTRSHVRSQSGCQNVWPHARHGAWWLRKEVSKEDTGGLVILNTGPSVPDAACVILYGSMRPPECCV